jgi:hypothetical protein
VSAFVANLFSRWFGRKTRTGRPDFSLATGADFSDAFDFVPGDREVFRRGREEPGAGCRAFGRGLFFIAPENSAPDSEGTIILRSGRASAIFPSHRHPACGANGRLARY